MKSYKTKSCYNTTVHNVLEKYLQIVSIAKYFKVF